MPLSAQHDFISLGIHAHREMWRLTILRLRLADELPTRRHDLRGTCDDIGHLKAQTRPGPLSFASAVNADHHATDGDLADDLILLEHRTPEDVHIEFHRALHVRRPDNVFDAFDVHA